MAIYPIAPDSNPQWRVTVPNTADVVTVEELKLFGRLPAGNAEDAMLRKFLRAATDSAATWLRRSLLTQTILLTLDYWPTDPLELPAPPLISVASVYSTAEDGTVTALAVSDYYVDTAEPARLYLVTGASYPSGARPAAGYAISYIAGSGADASYIPEVIKEGIMLWAMRAYEQRQFCNEPPPEAAEKMRAYRLVLGTFL